MCRHKYLTNIKLYNSSETLQFLFFLRKCVVHLYRCFYFWIMFDSLWNKLSVFWIRLGKCIADVCEWKYSFYWKGYLRNDNKREFPFSCTFCMVLVCEFKSRIEVAIGIPVTQWLPDLVGFWRQRCSLATTHVRKSQGFSSV